MSLTFLLIKEIFKIFLSPNPEKKLLDYYSVPDGRYHRHETDEWILELQIRYTRKD